MADLNINTSLFAYLVLYTEYVLCSNDPVLKIYMHVSQ